MKNNISLYIIAGLLMISEFCNAQNTNLEFGNPTTEEMNMTSCSVEPNAPAVVLCALDNVDYGVMGTHFCLIYDRKRRIKILTAEGKSNADVSILYHDNKKDPSENDKISEIKAIAYNMVDGKMVKTLMDSKLIFHERLNKSLMLIKFTMPQVRVGTVIEYEYKISCPAFWWISPWYAQTSIPTKYASYHLVIPEYFRFNIQNTGMCKMDVQKKLVQCKYDYWDQTLNCNGQDFRFTSCDMPSAKDDDFVWCSKEYCNKVTTELKSVNIPGVIYKPFSKEWKDIDSLLLDKDDFGYRLGKYNPFKKEMKAANIYNISDNTEKITAIYKLLKKNLKWNGDYDLGGRSFSDILKDGSGNNADLNFVLINMLNEAGIKAVPLVMSTRDHGKLPDTFPSLLSLNSFVVGAYTKDSTMVYLDSSEDNGLNVLPTNMLTDKARIIDKDHCRWVNLQNIANAKESIGIIAQLNPQGVLTGNVKETYHNNAAAEIRSDFKQAKDSAAFVNAKALDEGIEIQDYKITDRKSFSPTVSETYSFSKNCETTSDHIYVNPLIIMPIKDNPFTAAERQLPVEFPYKQSILLNVNMKIPEGYIVEGKSNGTIIETPNKEISCSIKCEVGDKTSLVQYRLDINNTFFGADDYKMIKDIFTKICESSKKMLVLKKM